jgi:hypothetical protein
MVLTSMKERVRWRFLHEKMGRGSRGQYFFIAQYDCLLRAIVPIKESCILKAQIAAGKAHELSPSPINALLLE